VKDKPKPLVSLTTHRVVQIGDEAITQRIHEWVSPDDPRVGKPGEVKTDYGAGPVSAPVASPRTSAQSDAGTAPQAMQLAPEETKHLQSAASLPMAEATVHAGPVVDACSEVESSSPHEIPKKEPRKEVTMARELYNEQDEEEETQEEDDVPAPITQDDLESIETMSPSELEGLIDHVTWHEELQELRDTARERVETWLGAMKKAEAAPRCEFVKHDGERCGSPALKGETRCYNHGESRAKRQAEEAAKILQAPTLEDRASVQMALTRVFSLLATNSIEDKTARVMIAALRLAHRNLGQKGSLYE